VRQCGDNKHFRPASNEDWVGTDVCAGIYDRPEVNHRWQTELIASAFANGTVDTIH